MLTLTYPAIGLRPAALSFPELGNAVAGRRGEAEH